MAVLLLISLSFGLLEHFSTRKSVYNIYIYIPNPSNNPSNIVDTNYLYLEFSFYLLYIKSILQRIILCNIYIPKQSIISTDYKLSFFILRFKMHVSLRIESLLWVTEYLTRCQHSALVNTHVNLPVLTTNIYLCGIWYIQYISKRFNAGS